jgi:hypothetical protein
LEISQRTFFPEKLIGKTMGRRARPESLQAFFEPDGL